ncbi:hypothetical protein BN1232_01929 [Mycobacterium lentiflavum]|uniref:Uncharacterized protein n=1 Tax=Mycobacterium lentiflavum TaxID=141349 RepID=A0A0E4GZS8_MYCLN|nr:hypothetical protein BN1232_01929 [Mycobacterium lentiflavum]
MTAGARSCRLAQTGSSLNRAAVHFVEQRVEQRVEPIVGVHVGAVAPGMRSRVGVAAADDAADTRRTFEVFSSRVVLHR